MGRVDNKNNIFFDVHHLNREELEKSDRNAKVTAPEGPRSVSPRAGKQGQLLAVWPPIRP